MTARVTLVALAGALLVPAAAPASTTVGSSLPAWTNETVECADMSGCTLVPRTIQGRVIAFPSDGVIVRWSARMPTAADTTSVSMKALELTATGARAATAGTEISPAAIGGAIVSAPTRTSVSAGDLIAVDMDDGDELGVATHSLFNSSSWGFFPPLTTDRPPDLIDNDDFQMLFNATVEPDADRDGYGDETQDKCPQLSDEAMRTCRGKVTISVAAGRVGIGVVGVGKHMPIHATIGMSSGEVVAGARLELTLPSGLKPVKLSGTAFCSISGQRVICPAGRLAAPNRGYILDVDALAERPVVGEVQATGTNAFGDTVTANDAIRLTTDKPCGLRIPSESGATRGTNGGDRLVGSGLDDQLVGRAGADCLTGGRGDDLLAGGDGDDRAGGGPGADQLRGEGGDDRLTGGHGRDALSGGPGDDVIDAVDGTRDVVHCGPGRDRVRVDAKDSVSNCERVSPKR